MNQDNQYTMDPHQQIPTRGRGSNTGVIIAAVAIVGSVGLLICGGVVVALLLPAMQSAREAARRMQCQNNIKQISLAMHNYQAVYGSFPPAYTVDTNGQPLHSWRTLLLPYLEQNNLYQQIDLTKPWNDPANQPLSELSIPTFACPSTALAPGMTNYVVPLHPQGIFSGPVPTKIADIKDGMSNTMLLVEVDQTQAVHWMEPVDIDGTLLPTPSGHLGGSNASMADGSVHFIADSLDPVLRDAMLTKDGGETIGF